MATSVPSGAWSAQKLMRNWSRAGYGEWRAGFMRGPIRILSALADAIADDYKTASADSVKTTVWQLHMRTGYCERWIRTCLKYLEEMQLITWYRGRWTNGKPSASLITVQRARLAALVRQARGIHDKRTAEHVQAVRDKIAALGSPRFLQSRGKPQPEAASSLPLPRGRRARPSGLSEKERRNGRRAHKALAHLEPYLRPDDCHRAHHPDHDPWSCRPCLTAAQSAWLPLAAGKDGEVS